MKFSVQDFIRFNLGTTAGILTWVSAQVLPAVADADTGFPLDDCDEDGTSLGKKNCYNNLPRNFSAYNKLAPVTPHHLYSHVRAWLVCLCVRFCKCVPVCTWEVSKSPLTDNSQKKKKNGVSLSRALVLLTYFFFLVRDTPKKTRPPTQSQTCSLFKTKRAHKYSQQSGEKGLTVSLPASSSSLPRRRVEKPTPLDTVSLVQIDKDVKRESELSIEREIERFSR